MAPPNPPSLRTAKFRNDTLISRLLDLTLTALTELILFTNHHRLRTTNPHVATLHRIHGEIGQLIVEQKAASQVSSEEWWWRYPHYLERYVKRQGEMIKRLGELGEELGGVVEGLAKWLGVRLKMN